MTAKRYLSQLRWIGAEIQSKSMEAEELRTRAEGCSAGQLSGMPGGSGSSDKMGDTVAKIVDLENVISTKIDDYVYMYKLITDQIDGMENIQHRIMLRNRYILNMNWEEISDEMCLSQRQCFRIHGHALAMFAKLYLEH